MAEDDREMWVVRDEESSPPSRAVSLRKLRRGVKLGKLHLHYEVAEIGSNEWMLLGELLEAHRAVPSRVLTESSVVTSAPNRTTSEREAERVLERPPRPRLRKIPKDSNGIAHDSGGHMTVSDEELSFQDFISSDDLEDDADEDEANETSQLPLVHVDAPQEPLPLVVVAEGVPHTPSPADVGEPVRAAEPSLRDLVVPRSAEPAPEPVSAPPPEPARETSPQTPPWPSTSVVVREAGNGRVVVTDIDMPFSSMVRFMVKWAFASIPALLVVSAVLGAIGFGVFFLLGALGLALGR